MWTAERGSAGVEVMVTALMLTFVCALLAATSWGVIDAKLIAGRAAAAGARAAVFDDVGDQRAAAIRAAEVSLREAGRTTEPDIAVTRSGGQRCGTIEVEVSYRTGLVRLPFLGRSVGETTVRAAHEEVLDPYRDGPTGVSTCG
ncbi:MAG: hypothetical protein KDB86_00315 [Actinobacteria bacterium]|nr:hypothetical protein [Actinomycetota bacterium]MCB9388400.1 hypothetical protein [Acidimicrobiia bacterium]